MVMMFHKHYLLFFSIIITNIWVILMEKITITSNVYEKTLPYTGLCQLVNKSNSLELELG